MKTVLITGAAGLLGQKLVTCLARHFRVIAGSRRRRWSIDVPEAQTVYLDITSASACKEAVGDYSPDIIVNAAAYTDVDGCEVHREECWRANVKGVENLTVAARKNMALIVHLSTDYVFDGREGPYREEHLPSPLGYYGKAKLASENAVRMGGVPFAIVRTNVLYGTGKEIKNNFLLWVFDSLRAGKPIRVVNDQWNNATLADDLADGIHLLLQRSKYGVYHMAGREYLNRYEFAARVAQFFGFSPQLITPITTAQLGQKAPRPARGGLVIERAVKELGYSPRSLEEALAFLRPALMARPV